MDEVPLLLDVDSTLDYFGGKHRGKITAHHVERACVRVGRSEAPRLVWAMWSEHLIDADVLAACLHVVWSMAEFPTRMLDEAGWSAMFDAIGYRVDGVSAPRPASTIRLWRGALPEHRAGWSWTDDPDLASWFAHRLRTAGAGARVWVADVEPERLLARITAGRPGESEYVVNGLGLGVEDAELPEFA